MAATFLKHSGMNCTGCFLDACTSLGPKVTRERRPDEREGIVFLRLLIKTGREWFPLHKAIIAFKDEMLCLESMFAAGFIGV